MEEGEEDASDRQGAYERSDFIIAADEIMHKARNDPGPQMEVNGSQPRDATRLPRIRNVRRKTDYFYY